MSFHFQEPGAPSGYLLERLLDCAKSATSGGAIVAWATKSGAQLLLGDPVTRDLYGRGNFELVVGMDSITNPTAIDYLASLESQYPTLSVRALIHDQQSLFHPKFYWFATDDVLTVFVGSGNLTAGGLKRNWEAFSFNTLDGGDRRNFDDFIGSWKVANQSHLRGLADPDVLLQAVTNSLPQRLLKPLTLEGDRETELVPDNVLIAEIPKSGDRWKQANFDKATYEGFFGASVGSQRRILLHEVSDDGTVGPLESRPSVEVISQNYRFELAGARGDYPKIGRPIGVFLRSASGDFLYSVLMPGTAGHNSVDRFLTAKVGPETRTMRRIEVQPTELWANTQDLGLSRATSLPV